MNRQRGFTLLEVLMVMAIIGILAAIMFSTLAGARARASVRDTAQQIVADLHRARSSAQRYNLNGSLTLAGDGRSYTLTSSGASTTVPLPSGVTVQRVGSSPSVATYKAPLGEWNSATGSIWQVANASATLYIKIIGVAGKAVVYAD